MRSCSIDTREDELDLESLQRADTVFKAGIVQFPDSVAIKLAYSNYLLHYANNAAVRGGRGAGSRS